MRGFLPGLTLLAAAWAQSVPFCSINTLAGSSAAVGDGGPATAAVLVGPASVTTDATGIFYFAEPYYHRVRRVNLDGSITTIAGGGTAGSPQYNVPAVSSKLYFPTAVAVDPAGGVYISMRVVSLIVKVRSDGILVRVAGAGAGFGGDGGPAAAALINSPGGMAVDGLGNLYFADTGNQRVRKINPQGVISTVAGNGTAGFSGDTGPGTAAQLNAPGAVAVDADGSVFVADMGNHRIRKLSPQGSILTYAGTGDPGDTGDGLRAVAARLDSPMSVAAGPAGDLYIVDVNNRVRRINSAGFISGAAGTGQTGFAGDGSTATGALFAGANSVSVDGAGLLYIADGDNHRIRRVAGTGQISTAAGSAPPFSGPGVQLLRPHGVAADPNGSVIVADTENNSVRRVAPSGFAVTIAGTGRRGFSGDGLAGSPATVNQPGGVAVDRNGNVFIADTNNQRIRRIGADGIITTVAGGGSGGDGCQASTARLTSPVAIAFDTNGNYYIADGSRVRRVNPLGVISTVAGTGTPGFSGDGGPAGLAQIHTPQGIAVDTGGTLYIADSNNNRLRKVSPQGGIITTIAGTGTYGNEGDGGPPAAAQLAFPWGLAIDDAGNVYVASANHVRRITTQGRIETVAGGSASGYSGDGGPTAAAALFTPIGLAADADGHLYIADSNNNRIRKANAREIAPNGIVNAFSFLSGPVTGGEGVSLFGCNIGPVAGTGGRLTPEGLLDTFLGEVRVTFDGALAPLFFVRSDQVNAVVPFGALGRPTTSVQVEYRGKKTTVTTQPVARAAPGIVTYAGGTGQVVALNEDGSLNGREGAAARDSVAVIFATGEGQTIPSGSDGRPASGAMPPALGSTLTIGGQPAEILFIGRPSGSVGLVQVNARIPARIDPGDAAVLLSIGGIASQAGVTISVR